MWDYFPHRPLTPPYVPFGIRRFVKLTISNLSPPWWFSFHGCNALINSSGLYPLFSTYFQPDIPAFQTGHLLSCSGCVKITSVASPFNVSPSRFHATMASADFFQIPPHEAHPCHWLTFPNIKVLSGLAPYSYCPCRAHLKMLHRFAA